MEYILPGPTLHRGRGGLFALRVGHRALPYMLQIGGQNKFHPPTAQDTTRYSWHAEIQTTCNSSGGIHSRADYAQTGSQVRRQLHGDSLHVCLASPSHDSSHPPWHAPPHGLQHEAAVHTSARVWWSVLRGGQVSELDLVGLGVAGVCVCERLRSRSGARVVCLSAYCCLLRAIKVPKILLHA